MFVGRYAVQVVSGEGTVSGLLNIAKCLYEAIHRLEKKAMKSEAEQGNSGKKQELAASLLKVWLSHTQLTCTDRAVHNS